MSQSTITTTLTFGPFLRPLSAWESDRMHEFIARAENHGFAVLKATTEHEITITAVRTEATAPAGSSSTRAVMLGAGVE